MDRILMFLTMASTPEYIVTDITSLFCIYALFPDINFFLSLVLSSAFAYLRVRFLTAGVILSRILYLFTVVYIIFYGIYNPVTIVTLVIAGAIILYSVGIIVYAFFSTRRVSSKTDKCSEEDDYIYDEETGNSNIDNSSNESYDSDNRMKNLLIEDFIRVVSEEHPLLSTDDLDNLYDNTLDIYNNMSVFVENHISSYKMNPATPEEVSKMFDAPVSTFDHLILLYFLLQVMCTGGCENDLIIGKLAMLLHHGMKSAASKLRCPTLKFDYFSGMCDDRIDAYLDMTSSINDEASQDAPLRTFQAIESTFAQILRQNCLYRGYAPYSHQCPLVIFGVDVDAFIEAIAFEYMKKIYFTFGDKALKINKFIA